MSFYSAPSAAAAPVLASIRSSIPHAGIRTSRVSQLDTFLLDQELLNILAAPLNASSEVLLVLKAVLLHLGLSSSGSSYGARLQNLVFPRLSLGARWTYVLLATVPDYLHTKGRDAMLVNGWPDYPRPRSLLGISREPARRKRELRRYAWDTLLRLEKFWSCAKLANFLLFLYNGRYPNLLAHLLRLRYRYAQKSVARNVSFDFLNRQLVWEAFTEFLLFLMPLVDLQAVRRWVKRTLHRYAPQKTLDAGNTSGGAGPLAHLPENICAICHSRSASPTNPDPSAHVTDPIDPTTSTSFLKTLTNDASNAGQEAMLPYVTDCCGAKYCYYCIASAMYSYEEARKEMEGVDKSEGWACLRCSKPVLSVERWIGDEGYAEEREGDKEAEQ